MNPGRELDALIAEKVMGWRILKKLTIPPKPLDEADPCGLPPGVSDDGKTAWVSIPHYSADIADAWQVVEKLLAQGFGVEILSDQGQWSVQFWNLGRQTEYGDSAPHAICLAALKVVGAL
jgi:hypothetical protein